MEAKMTTDYMTPCAVEDRAQSTIPAHELGAAVIVAIGFVLLLPGAALLMSWLTA
jgi:hypothetical protein